LSCQLKFVHTVHCNACFEFFLHAQMTEDKLGLPTLFWLIGYVTGHHFLSVYYLQVKLSG
jgi:hypothetical protein